MIITDQDSALDAWLGEILNDFAEAAVKASVSQMCVNMGEALVKDRNPDDRLSKKLRELQEIVDRDLARNKIKLEEAERKMADARVRIKETVLEWPCGHDEAGGTG